MKYNLTVQIPMDQIQKTSNKPGGTGKTACLRAIINDYNNKVGNQKITVFVCSPSKLLHKYVGESVKALEKLFAVARQCDRAVIIMDEIDSICQQRGDGDSDSTRRFKCTLLLLMDGINSKSNVLVVGTTNCPSVMDCAFIRRFQRRIFVTLPELKDRIIMFERVLEKFDTNYDIDVKLLGKETDGYSAADIQTIVAAAQYSVFRKEVVCKEFFKIRPDGRFEGSGDSKDLKVNWKNLPPSKFFYRAMEMNDLWEAICSVPRSNEDSAVRTIENWAESWSTSSFRRRYEPPKSWPFEVYAEDGWLGPFWCLFESLCLPLFDG